MVPSAIDWNKLRSYIHTKWFCVYQPFWPTVLVVMWYVIHSTPIRLSWLASFYQLQAVCKIMCYVNSTPALRFVCRDWPVFITQLCMQICHMNSTRALRFVWSMIGRFLSDHAVSSCITRSRNREQLYFQTDSFKVYSRLKLAASVNVWATDQEMYEVVI